MNSVIVILNHSKKYDFLFMSEMIEETGLAVKCIISKNFSFFFFQHTLLRGLCRTKQTLPDVL